MPNEEQNIAIIDVPMDEFLVFNSGSGGNHATLENLDAPDQHPIESIIGLETRLTKIESLKTVESDKKNSANYYKWSDGVSRPFGYFVTFVPNDLTITICDGSDIFGVTIEDAAFVGGQDALVPRDGTYGLVATFGVVDVRCAAGIAVGDYVVSDENGIAVKATENCGYKVFAIKNINTVDYVTISLGVQACTTNLLGTQIQSLDARVGAAEVNIADIRTDVSDAMSKIDNIILGNETTNGDLAGTIGRVDNLEGAIGSTEGAIDDLNSQIETIQKATDDAKRVADEAKEEAGKVTTTLAKLTTDVAPLTEWESEDGTQKGASYFVQYVNDENVKTKANIETLSTTTTEHTSAILQNGKSIEMVVTSIDKYYVGEYSPAYGMTLEEAKTILKDGTIYIPLRNNGEDSHPESYKTQDGEVGAEFTYKFYYEWSKISGWFEKKGEVWIDTEQPSSTTYDYWYDGNKLHVLSGEEWVEATTIAGNVNNRITSMIRQNVNSVAAEVASTKGDIAGIRAEIDETESRVDIVAGKVLDENGNLSAASIALAVNKGGSDARINADRITLTGDTFFVDENGNKTTIDGSHITAGSIKVSVADIEGAITANYVDATIGKIGGFNITEDGIIKSGMGMNSNDDVVRPNVYEATFEVEDECGAGQHKKDYLVDESHHIVEIVSYSITFKNATTTTISESVLGSGNTISVDIAHSGGEQGITIKVVYKYMLVDEMSPIRFFAGANVQQHVVLAGKTLTIDDSGKLTNQEVIIPIDGIGTEYTITDINQIGVDGISGATRAAVINTIVVNGNVIKFDIEDGEPNEVVQLYVTFEYIVNSDFEKSNFIVLDNGTVRAKAISIEGNSNVGGIYVDATNGLFNNSTFANSQCGILSNSNYYGYGLLNVSNGRLTSSDWSPIYLFAGQTGDGLQDGSGREDLVVQPNTNNCNFYVTQSGFVNAKSLLCDGGAVGIKSDGYDIAMNAGQFIVRGTNDTYNVKNCKTVYSLQAITWNDASNGAVGQISANYDTKFMNVAGTWRFNDLQVGSTNNGGNMLIENSQVNVKRNSNILVDSESKLCVEDFYDYGDYSRTRTFDVGITLRLLVDKANEIVDKVNEILTDKDPSADTLEQIQ